MAAINLRYRNKKKVNTTKRQKTAIYQYNKPIKKSEASNYVNAAGSCLS